MGETGGSLLVHGLVLISVVLLLGKFFLVPLGFPASMLGGELVIGYLMLFIGMFLELFEGGMQFFGALIGSGIITFIAFIFVSLA